jgi:beta-galactosidase
MTKHAPIVNGFPHLLHGGDYNPEQWIDTPEVWDEDVRLMRLAGCNVVSIGIFSWAMLEPAEDRFDFSWMDRIIEKLTKGGVRFVLATPGGAKPAWMAQRYPETLRVDAERRRQLWGDRHNHCYTAPAFRRRAQVINRKLAERYGDHPGLSLWHVNNEYGGECHCDLCQAAFRDWLRARYGGDLKRLNHAYWSTFWAHTITDWGQIESPSPIGEQSVHGLTLDWKRFVTDQTIACFGDESAPLRELTPGVPVTANLMGLYDGLDYKQLGKACDVVSWDSYPSYHDRDTDRVAGPEVSFIHDERRAMLGKPFILMESAPAQQNYKPVCKLKRPGMHRLEALQAIAHGSDSVMYFQWRKSRGAIEKLHGAVVDHHGGEHTRVFRDVADVGATLSRLDGVVGATSDARVAIIFDYQNRWALEGALGIRNPNKNYRETCVAHHRPFWNMGVATDVIDSVDDFSKYTVLVAPMLYMLRPGVAERIEAFVANGGTLVTTYLTGLADETDLCFLTGFPGGPLRKVCGVWAEETDALYDDESADVVASAGNTLGLTGAYQARQLCDLIHAEGADVLATYASQFYAGRPAVTVNRYGKGRAYYIASRNDDRFHTEFYTGLVRELGLPMALGKPLPTGVTAQVRSDGDRDFVFVLSFSRSPAEVSLGSVAYADAETGQAVGGMLSLPPYGSRVLVRPHGKG